jgi:hypothetical protein
MIRPILQIRIIFSSLKLTANFYCNNSPVGFRAVEQTGRRSRYQRDHSQSASRTGSANDESQLLATLVEMALRNARLSATYGHAEVVLSTK